MQSACNGGAYLRPNAVARCRARTAATTRALIFPRFTSRSGSTITAHLAAAQGRRVGELRLPNSVPSPEFRRGDIAGVRKAVLDAARQGFGAPGMLGVGVGGDRVTSMQKAKEQLFRPLEDENPDPELDAFEKTLRDEVNQLGIGPMGFGGKTTVLGVKAGQLHRLPACFFVSVAYMCWADRRKTLTIRDGQATIEPGGEE